jgi:hypothetical protein
MTSVIEAITEDFNLIKDFLTIDVKAASTEINKVPQKFIGVDSTRYTYLTLFEYNIINALFYDDFLTFYRDLEKEYAQIPTKYKDKDELYNKNKILATFFNKYNKGKVDSILVNSYKFLLKDQIDIDAMNETIEFIKSFLENIEYSINQVNEERTEIADNMNIKFFYKITNKLVKQLKEVSILYEIQSKYSKLDEDIKYLEETLNSRTIDPLMINRTLNKIMTPVNSNIILLLSRSERYKGFISTINNHSFFNYYSFIKQVKISLHHPNWEYKKSLIKYNTHAFIYTKSGYEIPEDSATIELLNERINDISFNLWKTTNTKEIKKTYLEYIDDFNKTIQTIITTNATTYIDKIIDNDNTIMNEDKLNIYINEITECLYYSDSHYKTNLNTITNLTERINKILKINIEIDDDITKLKTILETIKTGLSLIKYNINVKIQNKPPPLTIQNLKPILVGGSYTQKNCAIP